MKEGRDRHEGQIAVDFCKHRRQRYDAKFKRELVARALFPDLSR